MSIFDKIFGTYSDRELKRIRPIADKVMALEDDMAKLSDAELKAKTPEFKERLKNGETLDDLLPEAFAVMREASWRVLGMKHFYVQVIGGIILHQGRIAEMKTGEGKTLVSTLPAYLNALTGDGVHIVTVNDYLAKRDSEWMGKVYRYLGMSVGLIIHELDNGERREAYAADITYGTNNELGFDYLRDNMVVHKEEMVQRGHNYAVVDEVDSILIDEARTPLIISGMGEDANDLYRVADMFVKRLKKVVVTEHDDKQLDEDVDADYIVDEKAKTAMLTEQGIKKAEQGFGIENLSDPENMKLQHHINQALQANGVMHRDQQYVVQDGEVMIVDEFTGRIMPGRRYSSKPAYRMEGEYLAMGGESVVHGTVDIQDLKRVCREKGVSVTKYLTASLIWSICQVYMGGTPGTQSIGINLPINLRAFFGSDTASNFFAVTAIDYNREKGDGSFDSILAAVCSQMDDNIVKEKLEQTISYNVSNEKKWYVRILPLFVKWLALGFIFRRNDRAHTMTLSNIGPITMDEEYREEIENFHLLIGVSKRQPAK